MIIRLHRLKEYARWRMVARRACVHAVPKVGVVRNERAEHRECKAEKKTMFLFSRNYKITL